MNLYTQKAIDGGATVVWDGSGDRMVDLGSSNVHGLPVNNAKTYQGAAKLNGADQYFSATDNAAIDVTNPWSIDVRFRIQAGGESNQRILSFPGHNVNTFWLTANTGVSSRINIQLRHASTLYRALANNAYVVGGDWSFTTIVFDGAALTVYVNGVDLTAANASGNTESTSTIVMGKSGADASAYFRGWIGPVAIFPDTESTLAQHTTRMGYLNNPGSGGGGGGG